MWNAWFVAFSVMASIRSVECTQDMHIGHKSVFPNFHRKAGASCKKATAHTKSFVTWKSEIETVLIIRSLKIFKNWSYPLFKNFVSVDICSLNGAPTEDQEIDEKKGGKKIIKRNQPQIALVFVLHSHKKIANDEVE